MSKILWWGQDQYMIVINYDPYWIVLEHGCDGHVTEYMYVPHLNRIQHTPRGVRLIYGRIADFLHQSMVFRAPDWVEYATII